GTIEHQIGSRDIEDMDALILTRPALGVSMIIGILGMFLAPFGMLISKWMCIEALVRSNTILVLILAFGSAPTLFFWSKWLGKVVATPIDQKPGKPIIPAGETLVLALLATMTIVLCGIFPLIETTYIAPYLSQIDGIEFVVNQSSTIIIFIMLGLIAFILIGFLFDPYKGRKVPAYLAGDNAGTNSSSSFVGPMGVIKEITVRSYYLTGFLNEKKLTFVSVAVSCITLAFLIGVVVV
ncbi:MAG: hypothetical protein JW795_20780, partial [Chitinivibrionales bacterium]|nr:hypothetical protein [Chitinivibrionales bacterium]